MTEPVAPPPGAAPYPPPPPPKSSGLKWLIGCGIGCFIILILLGVIMAAGGYFLARQFPELKATMASQLSQQYEQAKTAGEVPAEHIPTFDAIVNAVQQEETSFMGAVIGMAAVMGSIQDSTVSAEEAEAAQATLELLQTNPDVGLMEGGQFVESHPVLQQKVQELQRDLQPSP